MKRLLSGLITFTVFSNTTAIASSINDNPWKLKSPIITTPAPHAGFYQNVIFQGGIQDLEAYVKYWGIKAKVYNDYTITGGQEIRGALIGTGKLWGVCHEIKSGLFHPTVCIAVNSKGRALDPHIYRANYR